MLEYSVIIRTTGKAGEKYAMLLESIKGLSPAPQEVIVVLPDGYELPSKKLGYEKFYFCPKGMVKQRLYGIEKCKTKYALISDDDIAFKSDFVSKLSKPIIELGYGISAGPLLEFFPPAGVKSIAAILLGSAVPTIFHKKRYNTLLNTTGYSYNRNIDTTTNKLYETQTAAWTCFFADIDKLRSIHFEDELWLDKNGYAAYDDTTMFYKAWINNVKSVIVSDALYEHLNAKTSTKGNNKTTYAFGFNATVFSHRFLYSNSYGLKKGWTKICFEYMIFMQIMYNSFNHLRKKITKDQKKAFKKGIADARSWMKTEEYKKMKSIK